MQRITPFREIAVTHPEARADGRRWFMADRMELYVWHGALADVRRFQLFYQRGGSEHVFDWSRDGGCTHQRIDEGKEQAAGRRGSPTFAGIAPFDAPRVAAQFAQVSDGLPSEIRETIADVLARYPVPERHPEQPVPKVMKTPWWIRWLPWLLLPWLLMAVEVWVADRY